MARRGTGRSPCSAITCTRVSARTPGRRSRGESRVASPTGTRRRSFALGDASGNLLALGLDERPALDEYCARACSVLHFGTSDIRHAAERRARGPARVPRGPAKHRSDRLPWTFPEQGDAGRVRCRPKRATDIRPRVRPPVPGEVLRGSRPRREDGAPAGFHRGLLPYYERFVRGRIGIVTCHAGLSEGLRCRMGAEAVDLRLIPPQAAIARGPRADTGHWPGSLPRARA